MASLLALLISNERSIRQREKWMLGDTKKDRTDAYRDTATDIRCTMAKAHAQKIATKDDLEFAFAIAKALDDLANTEEIADAKMIEKKIAEITNRKKEFLND